MFGGKFVLVIRGGLYSGGLTFGILQYSFYSILDIATLKLSHSYRQKILFMILGISQV